MASRAENLARIARAATPTLLGVFGAFMLAAPLRLFEGAVATPLIPLVVVYFWSLYSPGHLPAASIFFIGLLQDLLSGGPLGLWPAVYLAVQYVAISQQSYFLGRETHVVWMGFAVAAASVSIILWLFMSLMSATLLPLGGLVFQMLTTIAVYPLFAVAFGNLHRRVIIEV
ncbi:MAG TPA: rod shape-determining protein MreD [Parvularculaceae bacterium]|nr:rod shape-determining protein MreD [Parvularculaceae bacterium]HNS85342.1 rod shape-determining protein MreD [Parvularculaceae bacterium]